MNYGVTTVTQIWLTAAVSTENGRLRLEKIRLTAAAQWRRRRLWVKVKCVAVQI
jgi:hypothetical protein